MKLLLINSASSDPFCGLYDGKDATVFYSSEFVKSSPLPLPAKILRGHASKGDYRPQDKLINCLQKISKNHREDFENIDAISVVTGPGSFTGIRVGVSMAKGVSMALDKKIIPVTNFELTLNRLKEVENGRRYCVLIPAKLPEYYYEASTLPLSPDATSSSGVNRGEGKIEPHRKNLSGEGVLAIPIPEADAKKWRDVTFVGDFDNETELKLKYFDFINVSGQRQEIESMMELSVKYYDEGKLLPAEKVLPLYIKDFIVKKNAN